MPFLIFVCYIVTEVYAFNWVWDHFGFVNTLFAMMFSAILGIGIVRNQGRYVLRKTQEAMARGQAPTDPVLHGLLVLLGGLLFIFPGFVSDVLGLLFVLPGTRHLIARFLKPRLARGMAGGNFRVFTFGAGPRAQPQREADPAPPGGWERDVSPKVIDVKPISVESRESSDGGDS